MSHRIKIIDLELTAPPIDIEGLEEYTTLKVLARLHGAPLGYVHLPVVNSRCRAIDIRSRILQEHSWPIVRHHLNNLQAISPRNHSWSIEALLDASPPVDNGPWPLVTVAVCTRDRSHDLAVCLEALAHLDYPNLEIIVVDNAPTTRAAERLVRDDYPSVKYVCESRPGLNWARNRAIIEAKGEIIAYTDDDVLVDPGWIKPIAKLFVENPEVMAVTGLVVPYELETKPQILFEMYGGFGRGFERKWHRLSNHTARNRWRVHGTGQYGTGANMAYRRSLFEQIGCFDPALDVGTVTNGGGDLEMFFRVLKAGYTLVYEPGAIVRHRHRRDYARLRMQLTNNGIGLTASWVCTALAYPDERKTLLRAAWWWLKYWNIRRLALSFFSPARFPRDLILAEFKGYFIGLTRYQKARRIAARIAESFGPQPQPTALRKFVPPAAGSGRKGSIAVRRVDLDQPLEALADLSGYTTVRIFVMWQGRPLGSVDVANDGGQLSAMRLREILINRFGLKLLVQNPQSNQKTTWSEIETALKRRYLQNNKEEKNERNQSMQLPDSVPVSVVVATFDRPDDLRECLLGLMAQETSRPVEIIVVDNNPGSGLTPPVVAEFPGVALINEPRRGLAYARNAGFTASTGDIAVATDDDVRVPPGWLEKLVAPFSRHDVMIVTGHVLPLELDTKAQRYFEKYGGLGRGFEAFEVGPDWFESFRREAVTTWELGATANAAFRAKIFSHPEIGLMDEALGPGMPSGVGEDTYLFYKVLKAGYSLVYEPSAYVWHKHRREPEALRRQILNYSKGHVAYHLTTLIRDHDLRALFRLFVHLPRYRGQTFIRYARRWWKGKTRDYPLSLTLLEIYGNLLGPWALWQSHRRVKREGRSQPYHISPGRKDVEPASKLYPESLKESEQFLAN